MTRKGERERISMERIPQFVTPLERGKRMPRSRSLLTVHAMVLISGLAASQGIAEVIDQFGSGSAALKSPHYVRVGVDGDVFVTGFTSDNAFRITDPGSPSQSITEIINTFAGGAAAGALKGSYGVDSDGAGSVFVVGNLSNNVFKITDPGLPTQSILEIMSAAGDGVHPLLGPEDVVADASGDVYVSGHQSDNVFKITDPGGPAQTITQLVDSAGAGPGQPLAGPGGLAVGADGTLYVAGTNSNNVLKVTTGGSVVEILSAAGDGASPLTSPARVAVDGSNNVFVVGIASDNVFKVESGGAITKIADQGDGIDNPNGVDVHLASGNVFVCATLSDNAICITPQGVVTQVIGSAGDGSSALDTPHCVAVDDVTGNVFVCGRDSDNAFLIEPLFTASEVVRLGVPSNPDAFKKGVTSGPVIGGVWDPVMDHSQWAPWAIFDFIAIGLTPSNIPSTVGTILCGVSPPLVIVGDAGIPFAVPIPANAAYLGLTLCAQGGSFSIAELELANALDITLGKP